MTPPDANATIATVQTAGGAGGIAVVLLAGPSTRAILAGVFVRRAGGELPHASGRLLLGELRDGAARLDEAVVRLQPLPAGEGELAEINIHGGPRVTQRVLQLLAVAGAQVRPWEPGLTEAWDLWPLAAGGRANPAIGRELLEALPRARTAQTATLLMHQWQAGLSELAERALERCAKKWHGRLARGEKRRNSKTRARRPCHSRAGCPCHVLAGELSATADRLAMFERLLHPAEVVLAGPPNAGKSSLANALIGRDACIVTDTPGTTRDWVRELADLRGCPVWLTDTAGLWAAPDELDAVAVARAWDRIDRADLVLAVADADDPPTGDEPHWARLLARPNVLPLANKADLVPGPAGPAGLLAVSAHSGAGLDVLRRRILDRLGVGDVSVLVPAAFTARQAGLLRQAAAALRAGSPSATGPVRELLENMGTLPLFPFASGPK